MKVLINNVEQTGIGWALSLFQITEIFIMGLKKRTPFINSKKQSGNTFIKQKCKTECSGSYYHLLEGTLYILSKYNFLSMYKNIKVSKQTFEIQLCFLEKIVQPCN